MDADHVPHALPPAAAQLPAAAREQFRRFQAGEPGALDALVLAIIEDFKPAKGGHPLAELPGDTLLIDDLGLDSLAITEIIFCTEDLFQIRIANEEILQVRTLDDLRGFIRRKVAARGAS